MEIITSSLIPLHGAASTMIGGRPENQDDIGWTETPLGFLLVVCDGMGGGPGGKTASYIVKQVMIRTILDCSPEADRSEVMQIAVSNANEALENKMAEVPSLRGMGSTVVALLVNKESAIVAHLGDSRAYRLAGSKVLFRTNDHSLVGELVRSHALTEEQARVSPQSNVITRALGSTNNHVAEIDEVPFRKGDRFVLCTDGVWGIMPHTDLIMRLGVHIDPGALVDNLQAEIDRTGASVDDRNHDNHTLAIVEMEFDSKIKDKMSKLHQIIFATLSALLLASLIGNIVLLTKTINSPHQPQYVYIPSESGHSTDLPSSQNAQTHSDTQSYQLLIDSLFKQNVSLKEEISELKSQNDSLSTALKLKDQKIATSTTKNEGQKTENENASNAEPSTPLEIVDKILELYNLSAQAQDTDSKKLIKNLTDYRQQIEELLNKLNPGLNPQPKQIIKILPQVNIIEKRIDNISKDGYYRPTKYYINELSRSKKKVEELKKNISKKSK